jgi:hypothetical protein
VFDGLIVKQLADFSSRELLGLMMKEFHRFLEKEGIEVLKIDPMDSHLRIQLYTRRSQELMPGGGVRGVVPYVHRYDPLSNRTGKAVYLVADLTTTFIQTLNAVVALEPA